MDPLVDETPTLALGVAIRERSQGDLRYFGLLNLGQISVRSLPENLLTYICKKSVPDPDRDLTEISQRSYIPLLCSDTDLTQISPRSN
jgi:hypothetical protein